MRRIYYTLIGLLLLFPLVAQAQGLTGGRGGLTPLGVGASSYQPRWLAPDTLYVASGTELLIYYDQLALVMPGPTPPCSFAAICDVGEAKIDHFAWTPLAAGTVEDLTVYALDANGNALSTKTITLKSVDAGAWSGTWDILVIGDSVTASDYYVQHLEDLITAGGAVTPYFLGGHGTSPHNHEGRSGWTFKRFAGETLSYSAYSIEGVTTAPSVGDTYTQGAGGPTQTVHESHVGVDSLIVCSPLIAFGAAPDSLIRTSGVGDSIIVYTAADTVTASPFWDDLNGRLDFQEYSRVHGQRGPDQVFIMLGINDTFGGAVYPTTDIDAIEDYADSLVTVLLSEERGYPSCEVVICIEPSGSTPEGFAESYSSGYAASRSWVAWLKDARLLNERLVTHFDASAYSDQVTVAAPALCIDRGHAYATKSENRSDRDDTAVTVQSQWAHPDSVAHVQMGDLLYGHFLGTLPTGSNLVEASENYDLSDWLYSGTNFTTTKTETAPDGGSDAFSFAYAAGTGADALNLLDQGAVFDDSTSYVLSCYIAVKGDSTRCFLRAYDYDTSRSVNIKIDWSASGPYVYETTGTPDDYGIEPAPNDWHRIWLEFSVPAAQVGDAWGINVFPLGGETNSGEGNMVWGIQLEKRSGGPGPYRAKP